MRPFVHWIRLLAVLAVVLSSARAALALDHVDLRRDGEELRVSGKILVKAADGGLLVLARDGQLWPIPPDEQIARQSDAVEFAPFTADEISERLLAELPAGFEVYRTARFMVCYDTSRAYAQWCGALFERLYQGFTNYWRRAGFNLREPEFPMVAIVFADARSYQQFARRDLGDAASTIIGYYHLQSNRMTMFDLTGDGGQPARGRGGSTAQINQMLSRPEAERNVATVIHEATHQIAFNCGLQTRYADIPLWVSEGIAVYFEAPDLRSAKGWRTIGAVNRYRLAAFYHYLPRRPSDSLESLVRDDSRLRDPRTAADAYAETWAFNYFLLRERPKQYHAYLAMLAKKGRLVWDAPEERLKEFKQAFGDDLGRLDADFMRHMSRVR